MAAVATRPSPGACPRCRLPAGPADRFCGGCGLARPVALPVAPAVLPPIDDDRTAPVRIPAPRVPTPSAPSAGAVAGKVALGTLGAIGLLFRLVNGGLTVISGIAIAVIASHDPQAADHRTSFVLAGIAWALYGGYILVTRRSYWVSAVFTYLVPIAVIAYEWGGLGPHH